MIDLAAKPAVSGLPVRHGACTLSAFDPGPVTSIAPYPGRDLSAVLPFPEPGQVTAYQSGRLIWAGRDMAFLVGVAAPDLTGLAAVTDQSDGWAWVTLEGASVEAVLARLLQELPAGQEVFLDVPEPHAAAVDLARSLGLEPVFETARMYRGEAPQLETDLIFGVTSFELG